MKYTNIWYIYPLQFFVAFFRGFAQNPKFNFISWKMSFLSHLVLGIYLGNHIRTSFVLVSGATGIPLLYNWLHYAIVGMVQFHPPPWAVSLSLLYSRCPVGMYDKEHAYSDRGGVIPYMCTFDYFRYDSRNNTATHTVN